MSNISQKERISTYGLAMVVIGACIGSGIFLTPQTVAEMVGHGYYILLAWFVGGVIVLTGALTYSELAGLFPSAGGVYVYLKEAYGRRFAFLYGWSVLTVITSGSIAAITYACVSYAGDLFDVSLSNTSIVLYASALIVFNTIVHCSGIKIGEIFNNILAGLKVGGLLVFMIFIVYLLEDTTVSWTPVTDAEVSPSNYWIGIGLAMIPILWSFGGFQHASFLAGDARNPKKSVPIAMISGVLIVTVLYLLINGTFLATLGLEGLMNAEKPAFEAMEKLTNNGGKWVSLLIVLATFGSAFIFTMSAPRIYYAMAKDEVFFNWMAKRHKRFKTPVNAIVSQSVWSIILLWFWGTFKDLINYVTFLEWIFLLMAGLAVFRFRRQLPKTAYSFRMPLYPVIPIVFGLAVIGFLVVVLSDGNKPALYGLILLAVGLIACEIFKKRNQKT